MRLTSPLRKHRVYPCSLLSFGNPYPSMFDGKPKNLLSKAVPFFGLPPLLRVRACAGAISRLSD